MTASKQVVSRLSNQLEQRAEPMRGSPLGVPMAAQRILVINVKGGCGKTTVATNLASYYAAQNYSTVLLDYDSQGSSTQWLKLRDEQQAAIYGIAAHQKPGCSMTRTFQMRMPLETERIIIDAPGGLARLQLAELLRGVNTVLIPVLPSPIDMHAVSGFMDLLRDIIRLHSMNVRIGLILNRLRHINRTSEVLDGYAAELELPLVARLLDTQHYLNATAQGLGIHELNSKGARRDKTQWQELFTWLEGDEQEEMAKVAS